MINMTINAIKEACGGKLVLPEGYVVNDFATIMGVAIDNREVKEGFLFIPIVGARVDGHTFIEDALSKGALLVLSEKELDSCSGPYVLVKDTKQALKDIAAFYRSVIPTTIVGIIGSVGKTSTKEMVSQVLSSEYRVHKTPGNFNNEIGLPLTILGIRAEHQVAVVEMGISEFGEMSRLGAVARPDIAVMTNIGQCHLENLIDRDGILRAKSEYIEFMPEDGTIIVNGDDDKLTNLDSQGRKLVKYGLSNQEFWADGISGDDLISTKAMYHTPEGNFEAVIPLPGEHNVYNALAAIAVAENLGMTLEEIKGGMECVETIAGRNRIFEANGITVIDDCYNANPVSMKASVGVLARAKGRKFAVLGDMKELGADEVSLHIEVGQAVAENNIDFLFTVGPLAANMLEVASEGGVEALGFDDNKALIEALKNMLEEDDTVLIKASHSMNFTEIVEALS